MLFYQVNNFLHKQQNSFKKINKYFMRYSVSIFFCLFLHPLFSFAQKKDTVIITKNNINTTVLREGTHRYLVYFIMGKNATRTQTQFWTRTIKRTDFNGKPAIEVTQEWEDKDSIMHIVKSVSDAKTMQPIYHKTWWKVQTSRTSTAKTINETTVDFLNKTLEHNGKSLGDADSAKQTKAIWTGYKSSTGKFFLN